MTFEEFVNQYKKYGKCPGQMSKPGHTLNERELRTRYEKYIKLKEKKIQKGSWDDPKWKKLLILSGSEIVDNVDYFLN